MTKYKSYFISDDGSFFSFDNCRSIDMKHRTVRFFDCIVLLDTDEEANRFKKEFLEFLDFQDKSMHARLQTNIDEYNRLDEVRERLARMEREAKDE